MEDTTAINNGENGVDVSLEKDSGILKTITKEGEGDELNIPGHGSDVYVHYTGRLLNGDVFDSSRDRDQLFNFKLGEGSVIKGWDIGVSTMKKGEACLLRCAPDYAYGAAGSPPKIPENSTLVFEVELFYWKDEDITHDGGVIKKVLMKGEEGHKMPKEDASVSVHIRGTFKGALFEERDVEFILGEGHDAGICEGIEKALYAMKKREKVQLTIQSKYGFGEKGNESFAVPGNSEIVYEAYLSSFENVKESYEMSIEEKISAAEKTKAKGTNSFKAGDFEKALALYEKMVKTLDVFTDEEKAQTNPMKCVALLNAALCQLKTKQFTNAKNTCNKALEIEANNVKGLFRRGQAYLGLAEMDLAKNDFLAVLKLEPKNKAARDQLNIVSSRIKQELEQEKKKYGNMFEKFAKQDEQRKRANQKAAPSSDENVIKKAAEEARKEEETEDKVNAQIDAIPVQETEGVKNEANNGDIEMKPL